MFEWLDKQLHAGQDAKTADEVLLRIVAAMLLGFVVACIYIYTRPRHDTGTKGIIATIVLLSIMLSMVVMAVGGNLARSFTLAGVLAIVRFRTVVEDTRDGAFVICAVVVGMASGAGFLEVAIIGLPFIALAAYMTQNHELRKPLPASRLELRYVASESVQSTIELILKKYAHHFNLKQSKTCKKDASLEVTYRLRLNAGSKTMELVRELQSVEGMQSVEWKA
jgi:uncharacterized membrane protein YhiD involved in acid resistance